MRTATNRNGNMKKVCVMGVAVVAAVVAWAEALTFYQVLGVWQRTGREPDL